ncbi:Two component regulator propeller [Hydrobacter penzbergensis]|uniref:histidine kinase n=2 Tax=Pseudomonadati TaxID=3379134 RepID=A0A8X8IF37_9BACT|nr:two-component regulator propeller domain-containing protein [Hydrobacter penzbergensis]SDW34430.1 Two component regulator propeller [Hydrobacter penzbergensis]
MRYCWLVILCLFSGRSLFANDHVSIRCLGIENGLSNNFVTCILQDHNGFMWFGTYDGMNRYDAYSFKVFRNRIGDSLSLIDNHIYCLKEDKLNHIWIGASKGVSVYDPATSKFHTPEIKFKSNAIQKLNTGVHEFCQVGDLLFAGAQLYGLIVFKPGELTGRQISFPLLKGAQNRYDVNGIRYDSVRHQLWVFVNEYGLCKYDFSKNTLSLVSQTITEAGCMSIDKEGNLFVGNSSGLYKFDTKIHAYTNNLFQSRVNVSGILEDKQGTIWISSDGDGLWMLSPSLKYPTRFQNPGNEINSNAIYAVYEDFEGRKWIATLRGGINIMETKTNYFHTISNTFNSKINVSKDYILSLCEDEQSNVWIGTDGSGLRYWNRARNTYTEFIHSGQNSISSNYITNIVRDSKNEIWVSAWSGGVNRYNRSSQGFKHYTCFNPFRNTIEDKVWLVYEDKKKRLWASTSNPGFLYTYNRTIDKFELFDTAISNVQCLAEDKAGNLWGGDYTSLLLIDVNKKRHKIFNLGYPVRSIYEDKKNNFWIGTEGGGLLLFNRQQGTYKRITTEDGLPHNTILRILEDSRGNLWLSTYNGLCRFNPSAKTFRNFTRSDGLQSNQFSFNAALALRSGEFIFGGIKGMDVFYPDSIFSKETVPKVFLTGLKIDNKPWEGDDASSLIKVPFNKAILSLDFTALAYSDADKVQYAYYLKGWDKGWNLVSNIRTANYSRLQEGEYTFYVKTINADGVWSKDFALLNIKVLPPWYRTWIAYSLYLLLFLGLIYTYLWYYKKQEKLKYELKLSQIEASMEREKTEKEKELMERKMSFFTNISHEFRTPLTLIINPLIEMLESSKTKMVKDELGVVYRNARRLLNMINQILLFKKVENEEGSLTIEKIDLVALCKDVYEHFVLQAKMKHISFLFECTADMIEVYGDREKLGTAFFNLMSNAFKFTPESGSITFGIEEYFDSVHILVKDSGQGIPEEAGETVFKKFHQNAANSSKKGFGIGLYLVKTIVEAHKGQVFYKSALDVGTDFTVILLKGKSCFDPALIIEEKAVNGSLENCKQIDNQDTTVLNACEDISAIHGLDTDEMLTDKRSILFIDDDHEIRQYMRKLLQNTYLYYEAKSGEEGIELVHKLEPDLVISDISMGGMSGLELCELIKKDENSSHTPVILLTASLATEMQLEGIKNGADEYITKPFDKDLLFAKIQNILANRNILRQYFFDQITLKESHSKVPEEYQNFLKECIEIVEEHIGDDDFTVKKMARLMGMSHSALYKKVKLISGQSISAFISTIKFRRAAVYLINENCAIGQAAYLVGISDRKFFRERFAQLFGMNPSEYVKKYRKTFHKDLSVVKKRRLSLQ